MTVAHCDRLHGDLQQTLAQQFAAVHSRIEDLSEQVRVTNGRLRTVETDAASAKARDDERWRHHEGRGETASITRRDVQIVMVTLATVGSVLAMLRWIWPLLQRAFGGP